MLVPADPLEHDGAAVDQHLPPADLRTPETDAALAQLREALPEIPEAELASGLRVEELPHLFRVATFENLVGTLWEEQHG